MSLRIFWKQSLGFLILPLVVLLAGGCQTVERRIEQQAELFATFDPAVQRMIRDEQVDLGFTPEMVEIAWGPPDLKRVVRSEKGETHLWTYVNRHSVFAGRRFAGFDHEVFFDHRTKTHRTFMRPVYVDLYRTVETDWGHVEFEDGKVVSITRADQG
ncbi:MAG: hypothetical protein WD490_10610 [Opitutales bacterium]